MKFGIMSMMTDEGIRPAELGTAVEDRGFDSLFVAEHSHIPVSRETPYPGGGDLPREYYRLLDPFVALTAAATVTTSLLIGTGLTLVSQRDPIQTAKQSATLDVVSNGRLIFGCGIGWLREETRNHGTDPRIRGKVADERMRAILALWTDDEAEFHGDHVDFDPVFSWPKPVQRPHPPIYVGGASPATHRRIVEYGDGWLANPAPPAVMATQVEELRAHAGEEVPVTVQAVPPDPDLIAVYAELGVERVVLHVPTTSRDETLSMLDGLATLAASSS
ncbi:LLM class F420-dependent oxidoreductase [Actinokineospora spheciospongiae]|uniref:LLM class F420-dependent oxidoreductase n=1 Tax=Actinokineospora spheciospongiae TaxID=909613 RepID=UPI000D71A393|nr:LLM class F420-dependent oxidoreductase [Actinokineospora spheciospongiae]PWW55536.1 putative F420-dependent oxidoreductase [Actinokineospora spheciospongiae]